jgi:hypothetical protein
VLHARFEGPGVLFHASDNDDAEPMKGSAMMLEFDDLPGMRDLFVRMAAGGTITVPLARQYWGTSFGMLVDAFGVQWIFSCSDGLEVAATRRGPIAVVRHGFTILQSAARRAWPKYSQCLTALSGELRRRFMLTGRPDSPRRTGHLCS